MSRRAKWAIVALGFGVVALIAYMVFLFLKDEPPPDTSGFPAPRAEVSDADNALPLLSEAAALLVETEDFKALAEAKVGADLTLTRKVLAENVEALAKLDEAVRLPELQFEQVTSVAQKLPLLPKLPDLARLQMMRTRVLFQEGETQRAYDSLIESATFGRHIADADGALVHWLVGVSIWQSAMKQLREFIPVSNLTSDQLRAIAGRLSDAKPSKELLALALRNEWPAMESVMTMVNRDSAALADLSGGSTSGMNAWIPVRAFLRPNQTRRQWSEALGELIIASEHPASQFSLHTPTFSSFTGKDLRKTLVSTNAVGNILTGIMLPVFESVVKRNSRMATEAEMTRALICLRAYWLDHGALPGRLDDLVPEYLPAVPLDDFNGKPLRYSKEKRRLWSIGEDLIDEGGTDSDDKQQQKIEPTIVLDWAE